MNRAAWILVLGAAACGDKGSGDDTGAFVSGDADGDGYVAVDQGGDDCDDANPDTHPGADEICNGLDDDCDGVVDTDAVDATTWYIDYDGDGYGDPSEKWAETACEQPAGMVADASDCDDTDPGAFPGAAEAESDTACMKDDDGDGYGDADPAGEVEAGSDCDDADASVNPAATETWYDGVDSDCDGLSDYDADLDGFDSDAFGGDDCDDAEAAVNPDADEVCIDGIDNDCDGVVDTCTLDLADGDGRIDGASANGLLGYDVAIAGDMDGDGADDLLVGSWSEQAWLFLGPATGGLSAATATFTDSDAASSSGVGSAVAPAGDVDGDGYLDLVLAAPHDDTGGSQAGAVYLVLGPVTGDFDLAAPDALLTGTDAGGYAGQDLDGGGDIDGDGYADFIVGDQGSDENGSNSGAAYVVRGPVSGAADLDAAAIMLPGADEGFKAGRAVAIAGDIDGDGIDDVAVGSPMATWNGSDAGAVDVVYGPITAYTDLGEADATLEGTSAGDLAGIAVAGAGDTDGDGYDDLLVGAILSASSNTGAAYLEPGPLAGTSDLADAPFRLEGASADDAVGYDVDGAGDVNGDGLADILVGGPGYGDAGAAFLVLAPFSGTLQADASQVTFLGEADGNGTAGRRVAGGGDLDGDGQPDVVVADPFRADGTTEYGSAYIFFGSGL